MFVIRARIHKTLVRIANREDRDQTASKRSSLIRVCTVVLGHLGKQLAFRILEHLLKTINYCVAYLTVIFII